MSQKQKMIVHPDTGMSLDYLNEYSAVERHCANDDPYNVCRQLARWPIQSYESRFAPDEFVEYVDIITEKNRASVRRIDEIADIFNAQKNPEQVRIPDLKRLIEEAHRLISGEENYQDLFGPDPEKRWKLWSTND